MTSPRPTVLPLAPCSRDTLVASLLPDDDAMPTTETGRLRLRLTNPHPHPARCDHLELFLPLGTGDGALTPDAALPHLREPDGWEWHHTGDGRYRLVPRHPLTLAPRESLVFTLGGLLHGTRPGTAPLQVSAHTTIDGQPHRTPAAVFLLHKPDAEGGPIQNFAADQTCVKHSHSAKLTWTGFRPAGARYLLYSSGNADQDVTEYVDDKGNGCVISAPLTRPTAFTLTVTYTPTGSANQATVGASTTVMVDVPDLIVGRLTALTGTIRLLGRPATLLDVTCEKAALSKSYTATTDGMIALRIDTGTASQPSTADVITTTGGVSHAATAVSHHPDRPANVLAPVPHGSTADIAAKTDDATTGYSLKATWFPLGTGALSPPPA
ncbi:hypothetical protein ACF06Q_26110 [Streptomyces leeuwenhoekii]|uniref:hypothetical protein n=1 Tax=Streptomyces leeuwenhoekii TaxID=1437453 RepID=UPI0036FF6EDF